MATSNKLIFATGKYSTILPAISSGILRYPACVLCTDTNTLVFIDKDNSPREIYGSGQASIIHVDELPTENINSNAIYICDNVGYLYISSEFVPLFQDVTDYDALQNAPIVNKYGSVGKTIVLSELDDGCYAVNGQYCITSDTTTYLTSKKTMFLVDSDDTYKYITQFGTGEIILYTVTIETGEMDIAKYVTEAWVEEHGYATETYVQDAVKDLYETLVENNYFITKVSQLENDVGYISDEDLDTISDEDIIKLFEIL